MRCLVCLLIFISCSSMAKTIINEEFVYYSVTPTRDTSFERSLYLASPIKVNGEVRYSTTKWRLKWKFDVKRVHDFCAISKVRTTLDIVHHLPKIKTDDERLKLEVEHQYTKIIRHEAQSGRLAKSIARRIDQNIFALKPRNTCKNVKRDANEIGRVLSDQLTDDLINHNALINQKNP